MMLPYLHDACRLLKMLDRYRMKLAHRFVLDAIHL